MEIIFINKEVFENEISCATTADVSIVRKEDIVARWPGRRD